MLATNCFSKRLQGAGLLVFANKSDVNGHLDSSMISNALDLANIKTHTCDIKVCSAIAGEGVQEGMHWLVDEIRSRTSY
jgi:hypothetical protein